MSGASQSYVLGALWYVLEAPLGTPSKLSSGKIEICCLLMHRITACTDSAGSV